MLVYILYDASPNIAERCKSNYSVSGVGFCRWVKTTLNCTSMPIGQTRGKLGFLQITVGVLNLANNGNLKQKMIQ